MPDLYIITGSNGAGKSTVGPAYLPKNIMAHHRVFDGDLLFTQKLKELFPKLTKSPKEARNMARDFVINAFDNAVQKALSHKSDFVYEGHFTNDATWDIPKKFKSEGYPVHLIFLGLKNLNLSQLRVTDRVSEGGHYVNKETIEVNFVGNLEKLNQHFSFIDELIIIDSSEIDHKLLLSYQHQKVIYAVKKEELPVWFLKYLPEISTLIK